MQEQNNELIEEGLFKLIDHIEKNKYRGYDPYDALNSPIFRLPVLKKNKFLRFGAQQLVKRLPFNIRPLLFIPKGYNPVTLGLCIQGYSYLIKGGRQKAKGRRDNEGGRLKAEGRRDNDKENELLGKIDFLIEELKKLIPQGFHGACWGYDFSWEARYASIPAFQPNVVSTGIISNALYECYVYTGNEKAKALCISSADFVLNDLNKTYDEKSFCFSYSPFDNQQVFNPSMKGARLLAQAYNLTYDETFKTNSSLAVQYVLNNQNSDGSWYYSKAVKGNWIDNYHTGYILDCLDGYRNCTDDNSISEAIKKGYAFYRSHFIEANGQPRFYHNLIWPVDCTSSAQSILTLSRYGDIETAQQVAKYMITNMQSSGGGFFFRKFKFHTEKSSFMRWSDAWMFAALSYFLLKSVYLTPTPLLKERG